MTPTCQRSPPRVSAHRRRWARRGGWPPPGRRSSSGSWNTRSPTATATATYRLITTITDWESALAPDLAAAYHQRWEFEIALDEIETCLLYTSDAADEE